jgi:homocysteine S-methyltransferase
MAAWQEALARGGALVLDGGTGSELRRRGMPLDPVVWSALAPITHYELLRAIHADYIAAGADVVTTSTFATTRFVLAAAGHGDDFAAANTRAVAAARLERPRGRDCRLDLVLAARFRRARVS